MAKLSDFRYEPSFDPILLRAAGFGWMIEQMTQQDEDRAHDYFMSYQVKMPIKQQSQERK